MRPLAFLAVCLPFGPASSPGTPPPGWQEMSIGNLSLLIGPADSRIGLGGLTLTMPVKAAGGEGTATVRQGLTRDVSVTVTEADVQEVAKLIPDLPPWLKGKLVGRIGSVELTVKGDAFTLKAKGFRIPNDPVSRVEATGDLKAGRITAKLYALGGVLEYEGRIPGE